MSRLFFISCQVCYHKNMDIFAHALWTNAIYAGVEKRKRTVWEITQVVFWSDFPDFFSFGILFTVNLLTGNFLINRHSYEEQNFPNWLFGLHHILYSLPLFFLIFFGIWLARGRPYWPLGGWFIHIFIDIFTHTDFFPPHFLWPFYPNFHLSVISWANPVFMMVNYTLLALIYGYWFFATRRRDKN